MFVSHCQHISLCSPGNWPRASSSLRKQTVGLSPTISIFLYVAQAVEGVLAVVFGNKLYWFESHTQHISLRSPGRWTRASSSLRKQTVLVRVPLSIILYVAQAVERVLAVAFGNKLCWFESQSQHISVCSPDSWTRTSSSLQKQNMLVWVPVSAYFGLSLTIGISLCSRGNTNTHKSKVSMPPSGIRTHNLNRRGAVVCPATGTGEVSHLRIGNEN